MGGWFAVVDHKQSGSSSLGVQRGGYVYIAQNLVLSTTRIRSCSVPRHEDQVVLRVAVCHLLSIGKILLGIAASNLAGKETFRGRANKRSCAVDFPHHRRSVDPGPSIEHV